MNRPRALLTALACTLATPALAQDDEPPDDGPADGATAPEAPAASPSRSRSLGANLEPHPATGKPAPVGIGLGTGTLASGVSAEFRLDPTHSVQATLGAPVLVLGQRSPIGLSLAADYIVNMGELSVTRPGDLSWNVGGGAGVLLTNVQGAGLVGVSGVVGAQFAFVEVPVELNLDYRPTLLMGGGGVLFLPFSLGGSARWYF